MTHSPRAQTISLIITSYRQLHFLRHALASAVAQTAPFFQIIVVEDGSADETIPFLQNWVDQHDAAEVVFHDQNLGLTQARNTGLAHVKGDYVAFLDGDDMLVPNACEVLQAGVADHTPDLLLYNMSYVQTDGDGVVPAKPKHRMFSKGQSQGPDFPRHMIPPTGNQVARLFCSHPPAWQKLHRVDFLNRISASFKGGIYEDIPWHFEMLFRARSICYITDQLVRYRLHDSSLLSAQSERHMHILDQYERIADIIDGPDKAGPEVLEAFRQFRFMHLSFICLKSERLPEHLKAEFAQKALAVPTLTAFDLDADEKDALAQLQAMASR